MPSELPPGASPDSLREQMAQALAEALPGHKLAADALAALLAALAAGRITPEHAQAQLADAPDLRSLAHTLAGQKLRLEQGVIAFGAGSQLGDVSIGDVAGRDVVKLSFTVQQTTIAPELAYDVHGLPNPYRGLRAFTYAERESFAGRERLVAVALALLTRAGEERALLFVTGPSGSGKSSFAQAGLLPALLSHYAARGVVARYAVMRPSRRPLAALAAALRQVGVSPEGGFQAAAPSMPGGARVPRPDVALLVIDQFEELFTQSELAERDAFLDLLTGLPPLRTLGAHIICTLRSDFLAELAAYKGLEQVFREQVLLRAMDADELRAAILRPLQHALPEKRFEPALLERLVGDASGDAAYLPLLQVTLEDLWRRGALRLSAYSSLIAAIRQRAEDVYTWADYDGARSRPRTATEQAALLALLLGLVNVSLDDDTRRDVRRRRAYAELAAGGDLQRRLIDDLVAARLLAAGRERSGDAEVEVVDIIHERLINDWDRLRTAIQAQRATLQRRARFEAALAEWEGQGRAEPYLLGGVRLAEAEALAAGGDVATQAAAARAFLEASVAAREATRARELEQARLVNRRLQRRTQLIGLMAALALVAAVIATYFNLESRKSGALAEQRARLAQAGALASQSQLTLEQHPQRALLLAIAAARVLRPGDPQSPAIEQALRAGLAAAGGEPLMPASLPGDDGSWAALATSRNGRLLGYASGGALWVWDLQAAALAPLALPLEPGWRIRSLEFSPDGTWLAATVAEDELALWRLDAAGVPLSLTRVPVGVSRLQLFPIAFLADGRLAAVGPDSASLALFRPEQPDSGRLSLPLADDTAHDLASITIAASGDGRYLAAGVDETVYLWDLKAQDVPASRRTLYRARQFVSLLVFSPTGDALVTESADEADLRLWRLGGAEPSAVPVALGDYVSAWGVAFSPDGRWLLVAVNDNVGSVTAFDTQLEDPNASPWPLPAAGSLVRALAVTAEGRYLVGMTEREALIWDLASLGGFMPPRPAALRGHDAPLNAVAVAGGDQLFTAARDGELRRWRIDASGTPGEPLPVQGRVAAFSRDGESLVTAEASSGALARSTPGAFGLARAEERQIGLSYVTDLRVREDGRWAAAESATDTVAVVGAGAPPQLYGFGQQLPVVDGSGRTAATVGPGGQVQLWDLQSPDPVSPLRQLSASGPARAVALSDDGRWLAAIVSTETPSVAIWDLQASDSAGSRRELAAPLEITALRFDPGGKVLAAAGRRHVAVWSLGEGRELLRYSAPAATLRAGSIAVASSGKTIVIGTEAPQVIVLAAARPEDARALQIKPQGSPGSTAGADGPLQLDLSEDGRTLALMTRLGSLQVYDLSSFTALFTPDTVSEPARQFALLGGGRRLAICSLRGRLLRVYDLDVASPAMKPTELPSSGCAAIAGSRDGRYLASSLGDSVALYDLEARAAPRMFTVARQAFSILALQFSADSTRLLGVTTGASRLTAWDLTAADVAASRRALLYQPRDGVLSPDGKSYAAGTAGGTLLIWDLTRPPETPRILQALKAVEALAFSSDSRRLIVAGGRDDAAMLLLDLSADEAAPERLPVPGSFSRGVAFSPDGARLAAATDTGHVLLYELGGQRRAPVQLQADAPRRDEVPQDTWRPALAFSPDGQFLAAARETDRDVLLWDLRAPGPARVLAGHEHVVLRLAFSPDGRLLVSASADSSIRVWDRERWETQVALTTSVGEPGDLRFSPDGGHLFVGSTGDLSAGPKGQLFVLGLERLIARACVILGRTARPGEIATIPGLEMPQPCAADGGRPGPSSSP